MWVSDKAVNRAAEEVIVNREKRRAIQKMSPEDLTRYLIGIYRQGFEDGADAIDQSVRQEAAARHANPDDEYAEVRADWDDVLRLISEVRGVGPKLVAAIDKKLKETY